MPGFRRDAFDPAWWQPVQHRRRVVDAPPVSAQTAPRSSSSRRARVAGIVSVRELATTPHLPMVANFANNTWGTAFWLVRAANSGQGTLYLSSGARVLWDCGNEVVGSGSGTARRDAVWSEGLVRMLRDAATAEGVSVPSSVPTSGTLPAEWLRIALWYTYHRDSHPGMVEVVRLPTSTTLPELGANLGLGEQFTQSFSHYDPTLFATNPWGPAQAPVEDVPTTQPETTQSSSGGGGGALLLVLVAAGLALWGGEKR